MLGFKSIYLKNEAQARIKEKDGRGLSPHLAAWKQLNWSLIICLLSFFKNLSFHKQDENYSKRKRWGRFEAYTAFIIFTRRPTLTHTIYEFEYHRTRLSISKIKNDWRYSNGNSYLTDGCNIFQVMNDIPQESCSGVHFSLKVTVEWVLDIFNCSSQSL